MYTCIMFEQGSCSWACLWSCWSSGLGPKAPGPGLHRLLPPPPRMTPRPWPGPCAPVQLTNKTTNNSMNKTLVPNNPTNKTHKQDLVQDLKTT